MRNRPSLHVRRSGSRRRPALSQGADSSVGTKDRSGTWFDSGVKFLINQLTNGSSIQNSYGVTQPVKPYRPMVSAMVYVRTFAIGVVCVAISLPGCGGGGESSGPPPAITTQILSDAALDGDIEQTSPTTFTVTQGMSPVVQSVFAGIYPVTLTEFRAFLDFPLTGPAGVPSNAIIESAFLDVFIRASRTAVFPSGCRHQCVNRRDFVIGTGAAVATPRFPGTHIGGPRTGNSRVDRDRRHHRGESSVTGASVNGHLFLAPIALRSSQEPRRCIR